MANNIKFSNICKKNAKPGYVLDHYKSFHNRSITSAVDEVYNHITTSMEEIRKGWDVELKKFYIGKSHIKKHDKRRFDVSNSATWRLGNGINGRYSSHIKEDHGRNGLIVVAVVTRDSIPQSCLDDGTIKHQEEYALLLEKRLIQKFRSNHTHCSILANTTTEPGKTDGESSIAYAVYMTFTMDTQSQQSNAHIDTTPDHKHALSPSIHPQYSMEEPYTPCSLDTVWTFSKDDGSYRPSSLSKTPDTSNVLTVNAETKRALDFENSVKYSTHSHCSAYSGSTPSNKQNKRKRPRQTDKDACPRKKLFSQSLTNPSKNSC